MVFVLKEAPSSSRDEFSTISDFLPVFRTKVYTQCHSCAPIHHSLCSHLFCYRDHLYLLRARPLTSAVFFLSLPLFSLHLSSRTAAAVLASVQCCVQKIRPDFRQADFQTGFRPGRPASNPEKIDSKVSHNPEIN